VKTKTATKRADPTIKKLLKSLDESLQIAEADPVRSNIRGQIRRRGRLMHSMLSLMSLQEKMAEIDYRVLQEQFRKHSRFIRKAFKLYREEQRGS
jgi:hypothetical protein